MGVEGPKVQDPMSRRFATFDFERCPPRRMPEDRQIFPEHSVEDNLEIAAKKGPDGQDYWNVARVEDGEE